MALLARHHRVALLDPAGERVLVTDGGLPAFPERWPDPVDLAAAAGDPGAWAAGPPTRESDGTVTHVLAGTGTTSPAGTWVPLAELAGHGVTAAAVAAISTTAGVWHGGVVADDGRAAWFRPGWLADVLAWVDRHVERTGPPHPAKLWSLSAVLRIPTTGGPRWFKAACDGFRTEAALTSLVARLAPDVAPRVLAADADRSWLLLEEIPGADDDDARHAPDIARRLARLQLETLTAQAELRAAGARTAGSTRPSPASARCCATASSDRCSARSRSACPHLERWLVPRLAALWAAGLPDVLAHGDLHLGNAARVEDAPVLFDWTDTCLTHPFLDAWHLARSAVAETDDPAAGDAVRDAFLPAWREARPDVDHDGLWAATGVVESAFQMVTFEQILRAQPPVSRWELSGVVVETVERLLAAMDADPGVTRPTP